MNGFRRFAVIACLAGYLLAQPRAAQAEIEVLRNRVYVERNSGALAADIFRPQADGPFPAILVVHGGAWSMGSRGQLAAVAMELAREGYVAATISYRLAPDHKFPAQIHDCQAAVRWLRAHASELKVDPARIGGFGYSAGGHLVALLGTLADDQLREPGLAADAPSARLQAVIAGGAPCDFRRLALDNPRLAYWLGGTRAALPETYRDASPAAFVTPDDPPMFLFHGMRDALVPATSPQRMVDLLATAGIASEFYGIAGKSHLGALLDEEALARAIAFAERHLNTNSPDSHTETAADSRAEAKKGIHGL